MSKVDMKKKSKESSLLNTAFEFFTTKGFNKTSITDILTRLSAVETELSGVETALAAIVEVTT